MLDTTGQKDKTYNDHLKNGLVRFSNGHFSGTLCGWFSNGYGTNHVKTGQVFRPQYKENG
jgi:hypothetical protein